MLCLGLIAHLDSSRLLYQQGRFQFLVDGDHVVFKHQDDPLREFISLDLEQRGDTLHLLEFDSVRWASFVGDTLTWTPYYLSPLVTMNWPDFPKKLYLHASFHKNGKIRHRIAYVSHEHKGLTEIIWQAFDSTGRVLFDPRMAMGAE